MDNNNNQTFDISQLTNLAKQFLGGQFSGTVEAKRKPQFTDPPVLQRHITLGVDGEGDMRKYSQMRIWIKGPTQRFPKANLFVSFVNAKGSTYSRLTNGVDELTALFEWLGTVIPTVREKMESLAPLESQMQIAQQAYEMALNSNMDIIGPDEMPEEGE